jgi:hypothetical protein
MGIAYFYDFAIEVSRMMETGTDLIALETLFNFVQFKREKAHVSDEDVWGEILTAAPEPPSAEDAAEVVNEVEEVPVEAEPVATTQQPDATPETPPATSAERPAAVPAKAAADDKSSKPRATRASFGGDAGMPESADGDTPDATSPVTSAQQPGVREKRKQFEAHKVAAAAGPPAASVQQPAAAGPPVTPERVKTEVRTEIFRETTKFSPEGSVKNAGKEGKEGDEEEENQEYVFSF